MRPHTAQLDGVVSQGSFRREMFADVYYGGERILPALPLEDWSLTGDYDAKIKTAATATVVYQGDFAQSVKPKQLTDALAPFGQELRCYMTVSSGDFQETLPVGTFRIDEAPEADDEVIRLKGMTFTVGSRVRLTLLDRFCAVDTLSRSLQQPLSLTSAWAEIARLSRLPVTRTVADAAIPNTIVYSRNRLEAVQQLAGLLGGRAFMRSDGTLGIIPDTYGAATTALKTGEPEGTIIAAGYFMTSAGVANVVVGDFEDASGAPIHVERAVSSGPLDVAGPFGERVVEFPDDQKQFIRTQSAAVTAVENYLAKVSKRGPVEIPVSLVPDPRLEIGDIVTVQRSDEVITGRVVKFSHPRKGAMQITVRTAA